MFLCHLNKDTAHAVALASGKFVLRRNQLFVGQVQPSLSMHALSKDSFVVSRLHTFDAPCHHDASHRAHKNLRAMHVMGGSCWQVVFTTSWRCATCNRFRLLAIDCVSVHDTLGVGGFHQTKDNLVFFGVPSGQLFVRQADEWNEETDQWNNDADEQSE